MKKIALVAALAAVAAPAFAQSSVTLWGRINTTVESQKEGNQDRKTVVQNNSSRLGLKGTEDLGGGLKASFALEHGFNSDTGSVQTFGAPASTFWSRASYVELGTADTGSVRLGKWFPGSYFATADYVSMHNHDTGTSSDALYAFGNFASATQNKVAYFSPTISGFQVELAVSAGEGTAATAAERAVHQRAVTPRIIDVAVNYDQGPLHGGFGYQKQGDFSQYALRGLYEMGPFVFGGYAQREEVTGRKSRDIGRISAMYVVGAQEFHINVGGTKSGGTFGNTGASQYTLGYNYNLSKRTKIYGFYTAIDNKAPGKVGDFSSLAAGIRHNF